MLYKVQTKVFNQAVKRNIDRFPEHFRFQLTEKEYEHLRSQIVTSSVDSKHGGGRYMPFVFTESGIAMLSAVLKNDVAVEVSIRIMDSFVAMRNFLTSNQDLSSRLDKGKILLIDNYVDINTLNLFG